MLQKASSYHLAMKLHNDGWTCRVREPRRRRKKPSKKDEAQDDMAMEVHSPSVPYLCGGQKDWWLSGSQQNFKRDYMLCLLCARDITKPIPHNLTETHYACLLKGEEFHKRTTFKMYTDITDKPPPSKRRRKIAPKKVVRRPREKLEPLDVPGVDEEEEPESEACASEGSSAASSTSGESSGSSKASKSSKSEESDRSKSSGESSEQPAPAPVEPPAEPPVKQDARVRGGPGGGGGVVAEGTFLWKTFKFTEVKNEVFEVVGFEVSCHIQAHKHRGPRCSRTLRFKRYGGRDLTERCLKWWCVQGFDMEKCATCPAHKGQPYKPDGEPPSTQALFYLW